MNCWRRSARPDRLQPIQRCFITKLAIPRRQTQVSARAALPSCVLSAVPSLVLPPFCRPSLLLPSARTSWRRSSSVRLSLRRPCVPPSSVQLCVRPSWRQLCALLSSVQPSWRPSSLRLCVRLSLPRLSWASPSLPRPYVRPFSARPYDRLSLPPSCRRHASPVAVRAVPLRVQFRRCSRLETPCCRCRGRVTVLTGVVTQS
jgi:hypothetical protein